MKFKRWGTLVPQKHFRENDFCDLYDAPVELGIYAFPAKYASWDNAYGFGCISNGRYEYVKDKDGKRVMMTQKELDAIVTKERGQRGVENYKIVVAPDYLRGMYYESLFLKKSERDAPYDHNNRNKKENKEVFEYNENEGLEEVGDDNEDEGLEEDDKPYPLMKCVGKLRTFNYEGNIWHHLEFTNAYEYWRRSPDGVKKDKQYILEHKNEFKDWKKAYESAEEFPEMKFKRLVRPEYIIRRSGSWILTDMRTYQKALEKAMHIAKYDMLAVCKKSGDYEYRNVEGRHMGLPKKMVDLGNFEVFIEKVK